MLSEETGAPHVGELVWAELVLVEAVRQEAHGLVPWSLPLPRFSTFCSANSSTFCSAARGDAAANPKREEIMMVERMAMRTCDVFERI